MNEGLSGGGEGRILAGEKFTTNRLSSWRTSGELNIPLNVMVDQTLTVGAEWNRDKLDDPSSTSLTVNDSDISGISGSAADRSSKIILKSVRCILKITLSRFLARISFPACALIISATPAGTSAQSESFAGIGRLFQSQSRGCPNL